MMRASGITDHDEAKEKLRKDSGEVFAAIAMALHEYQEDAHDIEDTILTINKVKRNYSPWSSRSIRCVICLINENHKPLVKMKQYKYKINGNLYNVTTLR